MIFVVILKAGDYNGPIQKVKGFLTLFPIFLIIVISNLHLFVNENLPSLLTQNSLFDIVAFYTNTMLFLPFKSISYVFLDFIVTKSHV